MKTNHFPLLFVCCIPPRGFQVYFPFISPSSPTHNCTPTLNTAPYLTRQNWRRAGEAERQRWAAATRATPSGREWRWTSRCPRSLSFDAAAAVWRRRARARRAAAVWRRRATMVAMVATAGRRLRRKGRRRSRRLVARGAMARATNDSYDIARRRTTAAHRGRFGQRSCIA